MSRNNYEVNQSGNIGFVQGVHYGDNIFYSSTTSGFSPRHVALETHKKVKTEWEAVGTGEWLLKEWDYRIWEEMEKKYSFLWLYGRPGFGKTTLMSRVIESISQNQSPARNPETIQVLYFYVTWSDDKKQDELYQNILVTFWDQSTGGGSLNIFQANPLDSMETALHDQLVSSKRDTYIVIDALDQLPSDLRYRLTGTLHTMVRRFKEGACGCRLSVAISSRDKNWINALQPDPVFRIEVTARKNESDIEIYLGKALRSPLFDKKPELRQRVLEELKSRADGMFLWVRLQALDIRKMEYESQVTAALDTLVPPENMKSIYARYAKGFDSINEPVQRQVVQRTMALLARSSGSMPKETMLTALSLNRGGTIEQKLYQDLVNDPTGIVRFCNHLVQINDNLGIFQFCHRTVFEFFRVYDTTVYHYRIAELCLSQLCSPEFSDGPRSDATWYRLGSLESILKKHPFLLFASSRWATSIKNSIGPKHNDLSKSHASVLDLLYKLLFTDEGDMKLNLQLAFQVYLLNLRKPSPATVSHEHIISYFSLVRLLDPLRDRGKFDFVRSDTNGLKPIHWAIRSDIDPGDITATVEKLLDYGTSVNETDNQDRTPLYYASHYGNLSVVDLLVRRGAQLDRINKDKETALIAASREHHEKVVMFLLESKADVKIQSMTIGTALQAISVVGCCCCANAILTGYGTSKIRENEGLFGTSLHAAAFYGHFDLVKLLCSKRTDPRATNGLYGGPVTAAAAGYYEGRDPVTYEKTILELIKHGARVNDRRSMVGPALRVAAWHGSRDLVRLLLDQGAKVRKATGSMGTAYEAADSRGHQEIKDLLLKSDPKAAHYRAVHSTNHQQFQRLLFKATLKGGSIETISSLIGHFETMIQAEMEKGETFFLRLLAKVAEDAFQDTVDLATHQHKRLDAATRRRDYRESSRRWNFLFSLFCVRSASKDRDTASRARPAPHLDRASSTFNQDNLGDYFPKVLDRLTQAAVNILQNAIANKDRPVVRLIANTWVRALNNLLSYSDFGEPMLEDVVQTRAKELKQHLTNTRLPPEDRLKKAQALAQVGIELLVVAVEHGPKFKRLSSVISKLWIKAITDLDDLGREGDRAVQGLVCIYTRRFSDAVRVGDLVHIEAIAQAGIELLRATALAGKKTFLNTLGMEWARLIDGNMVNMVAQLLKRREEEYRQFLQKNTDGEGLELALASMEMLRATLKMGNLSAASLLHSSIEFGFQLAREHRAKPPSATRPAPARRGQSTTGMTAIFDGIVGLFATAEEVQPGFLRPLVEEILKSLGAASNDYHEGLRRLVDRRIEEASASHEPAVREERLNDISITALAFLGVALDAKERIPTLLSTLKSVASESLTKLLLDSRGGDKSTPYTTAMAYLAAGDINNPNEG